MNTLMVKCMRVFHVCKFEHCLIELHDYLHWGTNISVHKALICFLTGAFVQSVTCLML